MKPHYSSLCVYSMCGPLNPMRGSRKTKCVCLSKLHVHIKVCMHVFCMLMFHACIHMYVLYANNFMILYANDFIHLSTFSYRTRTYIQWIDTVSVSNVSAVYGKSLEGNFHGISLTCSFTYN